ncbi:MAG: FtsK/SpoIIIE domain-containing protein [Jatrophihabitans sp.]
MHVTLTVVDQAGNETDLAITARSETTLAEIRPWLIDRNDRRRASISSPAGPLLDTSRLGDPGLRAGCRLRIGHADRHSSAATGSVLRAHVVSGPDCGQILFLRRGSQLIGRMVGADLQLDDPDVSRRHAELLLDPHTVWIRDLGSTNGTRLDGVTVGDQPRPVTPGCLIELGSSQLSITGVSEPPMSVSVDADGFVRVRRPPRPLQSPASAVVEFPAEPADVHKPKMRWVPAALPAVVATVLALSMHSTQFLAFAVLSPLAVAASAASDRRDWRTSRHSAHRRHAEAERVCRAELAGLLLQETEQRRRRHPDPAAVMHSVRTPDCRLWERGRSDPSFLHLRLGVADQPAETAATRGGRSMTPVQVAAVPAVVTLAAGAIGVAGPLAHSRATARWLLAQLLALHSPADLTVVALVDGECPDWRWLRWPLAITTVATTVVEWQQVIDELAVVVRQRRAVAGTRQAWSGPWTVLLVEQAVSAADVIGLVDLIDSGPPVGISAICVGADTRALPSSCRTTVNGASDTGSRVELTRGGQSALRTNADRVRLEWAEEFARHLAPLRDADIGRMAPADQVGLAELLGLTELNWSAISARWAGSCGRPTAPIGLSAHGPFELDLVRDGPHLLIAGTTGSGKSELLKTLVTSLAASCPPDEIAFVLIDYKGGSAFAECAQLPHVMGVVTDLDNRLTQRALVSLDAELRRREAAFARASVADLAQYRDTVEATRCPLPRLVLVVDEFAALAEELPGFVSGLLSIAQRGRSLGLHLVLATQRPAGVVSASIKANMSLRIALRVTDASESDDVIGDQAASLISRRQPGRALARLSDGEIVEFQTARADQLDTVDEVITVTRLGFWNAPQPERGSRQVINGLAAPCTAIVEAADHCQRPVSEPPWLAPLPDTITTSQMPQPPGDRRQVAFGLTDDPERQRQFLAVHDFARGGSIGFVGGPRSGRTSALRTLLGQAARRLSADDLHLYLIDCAGHGLAPLARLPHCGALVDRDDPALVVRLINRLITELGQRQQALARLGAGSLVEAHQAGAELPVLVLVIDGWEGLVALSDAGDGGRTIDSIGQLLRDGPAAGLTVLVAGDRGLLGLRIGSALTRKLIFNMTDRADCATAGITSSTLPTERPPGRAIEAGTGLETQVALLVEDTSTRAQQAAMDKIATLATTPVRGPTIKIRPLPDLVSFNDLKTSVAAACRSERCALGVGGDDATTVLCDLFASHSRFLIVGPARSGRSNTAILIASQAMAAGIHAVLAAPPRSPLSDWASKHAIPLLAETADTAQLASLIEPGRRPLELVLIDDAEQFTDTFLGDALLQLVAHHRAAIVGTARTDDLMVSFRGLGAELRRHRTGLLLQPDQVHGELLGIDLTGHRRSSIAGRGVLVTDHARQLSPAGIPVQVAR